MGFLTVMNRTLRLVNQVNGRWGYLILSMMRGRLLFKIPEVRCLAELLSKVRVGR